MSTENGIALENNVSNNTIEDIGMTGITAEKQNEITQIIEFEDV